MREWRFNGKPLGAPSVPTDTIHWLFCGRQADEDALPTDMQDRYCGGVFHCECIGLVRKTKKTANVRVACLHCASDPRYRPRPPPSAKLMERVVFNRDSGLPRILDCTDSTEGVKVLLLECDCKEAVGSGLPCEGMLAVARHVGGTLNFRHYHQHWFNHTVEAVADPIAAFEGNERLPLDVQAVLESQEVHARPSTLEDGMPAPEAVKVRMPAQEAPAVHGKSNGARYLNALLTKSVPGGGSGEKAVVQVIDEEDLNLRTNGVKAPKPVTQSNRRKRLQPKKPRKN